MHPRLESVGATEAVPQIEDDEETALTVEDTEDSTRQAEDRVEDTTRLAESEASLETGRRKVFLARPRKLDFSGRSVIHCTGRVMSGVSVMAGDTPKAGDFFEA